MCGSNNMNHLYELDLGSPPCALGLNLQAVTDVRIYFKSCSNLITLVKGFSRDTNPKHAMQHKPFMNAICPQRNDVRVCGTSL